MKENLKILLLLVWTYYLNDFYLIVLSSDHILLLWTLDFIFYFLVPTATLVWLVKSKRISLIDIGLGERPKLFSLLTGLFICLFLLVTLEGIFSPLFHTLSQKLGQLSAGYSFPNAQPMRGILVFYASISAGVLEEIIFRGVVTTTLQKYIESSVWLVILSSLVFAGIHWSEGLAIVMKTFVWALLPTIWYLKRRELWGPILCHFLYDYYVFGFY